MKRKALFLAAVVSAAALLLGSCNFGARGEASGEAESGSGSTLPEFVASAQPYAGPGAGEYFNAECACLLRLDGDGGFSLSAAGGRLTGTYTATETEIVLLCGGEELRAVFNAEALVLPGAAGFFRPLEELDSFSELGVVRVSDRDYTENDDGSYTLSDYVLQLGLNYPGNMSAPENIITDAVVVWDEDSGYVCGRNVTEDFSGEAEAFVEDYMSRRVPADFRLLYGCDGQWESMELLSEGVPGRLSSAEGIMTGGERRIYVKCIMYTSTYADGTVNHICKCFFAPEGDTKAFNVLANSVVNMTAVRRK